MTAPDNTPSKENQPGKSSRGNPLDVFTPAARQAHEYTLVEPQGAARLHQNEGAPLSSESTAELARVVEHALSRRALNCYPNLRSDSLSQAYADFLGVPEKNIELTAGSSQGIALVSLACFAPGRRVAVASPSFSIYEHYAYLNSCEVFRLALDPGTMEYRKDVVLSPEALEADVVMLCTPNNPTGGLLPVAWVRELCDRARGLVVVDEAYIEFAGDEGESLASEACVRTNLVVLRTLSKAWGLAGLRVGVLVAHESLLPVFRAVKPPYSFSFLSEVVAAHVLVNWKGVLAERVAFTRRECESVVRGLSGIPGITLFRSHANFVCFRHARVKELERVLREEDNILIRVYGSAGPLANVARVSAWDEASDARFLVRAQEVLARA